VIDKMPCTVGLLKVPTSNFKFYDFDKYRWPVEAAEKIDTETLVTLLIGGDAGLRLGEIIALEWDDIDFRRETIQVQQAEWQGIIGTPKGGRS
jgi:integrase